MMNIKKMNSKKRKRKRWQWMTTFKTLLTFVNITHWERHVCILHSLSVFPFPVPVIDPIPTERFPEYVRDMLYGEENKLKVEFLVRSPYMASFHLFMKTCLCKLCKCAACVSFPTPCVGKVMIATFFCVHRLWENYLNHPLLWQSYLTTRHTTDSTTSILVS